eukprot:6097876-Lingulodinium_polyedra.AAC.1
MSGSCSQRRMKPRDRCSAVLQHPRARMSGRSSRAALNSCHPDMRCRLARCTATADGQYPRTES